MLHQNQGFIRAKDIKMNNVYNLISDYDLIVKYQNNNDDYSLNILIERHCKLLEKIARAHSAKFQSSTYEDCLQNARVGLILAAQRFQPNSGAKFSSFLYKTVYYYLLSCNDKEAFINIPSNLSKVRNYLNNNDPKIESEIKQQFGLRSIDDINEFEKKYQILKPNSIIVTDTLPEKLSGSENQIVSDLNAKIIFESLDENKKLILRLIIEGYTVAEIARKFSGKFTARQIKNNLLQIQKHFV